MTPIAVEGAVVSTTAGTVGGSAVSVVDSPEPGDARADGGAGSACVGSPLSSADAIVPTIRKTIVEQKNKIRCKCDKEDTRSIQTYRSQRGQPESIIFESRGLLQTKIGRFPHRIDRRILSGHKKTNGSVKGESRYRSLLGDSKYNRAASGYAVYWLWMTRYYYSDGGSKAASIVG